MKPSLWPKWLKVGLGIMIPLVGVVGSVAGGMWALDERYEPRKELRFEFQTIAMTQKALLNKVTLGEIRSWLVFWQLQVELYTRISAKNPGDVDARDQLNRALRERQKWQDKLNAHVDGD
jgi:hypothetical protein